MSRSAPDRWPISSERVVKSGISWRTFTPRRTRSAASARRRTGLTIVPASRSESTIITKAATRKTWSSANRSEAMMPSMSPPCVERSRAPLTARKRWIGTATETMVSPRAFAPTTLARATERARCCTSRRMRPFGGRDLLEEAARLAPEEAAQARSSPLDQARVLLRRRAAGRGAGCRRGRKGSASRGAATPPGRRCGRACASGSRGGAAAARRAPG